MIISQKFENPQEISDIFYDIFLRFKGIKTTRQERKILVFAASRPNISSAKSRRDCQEELKISAQSLNNTIARLQKIKLFIKDEDKIIKVNPHIKFSFPQGLKLQLDFELDS
jgi:hypothetical protein